jgi:hypothetical protein
LTASSRDDGASPHFATDSPVGAPPHHHSGPLNIAIEVITAVAAFLLFLELLRLIDLGLPESIRHFIEGTLHAEKVWTAATALLIWLSSKWAPFVESFAFVSGFVFLLWQRILYIARFGVVISIAFALIFSVGYIVKQIWPTPGPNKDVAAAQPTTPPRLQVFSLPRSDPGIACQRFQGARRWKEMVSTEKQCHNLGGFPITE